MKYQRTQLFKSSFLEKFTVTHPCVPAVIFIPVILFFLLRLKISITSLTYILLGILTWTFMEYVLHRFVFHLPINTAWAKKARHYLHDTHHEIPKDPLRIVTPPIMSISIYSILFYFFSKTVPSDYFSSYMIGFTQSYLCFEYLHWAIHNNAINIKPVNYLRRHHAIHHYVQKTQRFGLTSPFWDIVFNTYKPKKTPLP